MSVATFKIDPAVERIWRENRCCKEPDLVYRYRVHHFIEYCRIRDLPEKTQLTRAGVRTFLQRYARSQKLDVKKVFDAVHSALIPW